MKPTDARALATRYADGELDHALRAQMDAHLAGDPALRAEVDRWQALRRSARRAIDSTPVPTGLANRVRARLQSEAHVRPRAVRVYRLGLSGLAAAAVVVLAATLWPRGAVARPVEANGFAHIHQACAVLNRHDTLDVRGGQPWGLFTPVAGRDAIQRLAARAAFACEVPDLTQRGFRLSGACECSPTPDLRVVHAYFCSGGDRDAVVSVFAVDGQVALCTRGTVCPGCSRGDRRFRATQDNDVSVVCWLVDGRSFLLAGAGHTAQELVDLADGLPLVKLERMQPVTGTGLATASPR